MLEKSVDEIKISVILPVYNVEPWIGECIESLKRQKQEGLEFIFVDDCSTDGSMKIVEEWAAEDERVRIIRNNENIGQGPSRNAGIEVARGEYLSFIDPDDWIRYDFYELLYAETQKTGCDIVKGVRARIDDGCREEDIDPEELIRPVNKRIVTGKNKEKLYIRFTCEHQSAIYKRKLFDDAGIRYGTSRNAQDTTFLLKICYQTESIEVIDKAVYYYRQRQGAATNQYTFQRAMNELQALDESLDFLIEKGWKPDHTSYLHMRIAVYLSDYYRAEKAAALSDEDKDRFFHKFESILNKSGAADEILKTIPELEVFTRFRYAIPVIKSIKENYFREGVARWTEFLSTHRDAAEMRYFKGLAYAITVSIAACYKSRRRGKVSLKNELNFYAGQLSKIPARGRTVTLASLTYYMIRKVARKTVESISYYIGSVISGK